MIFSGASSRRGKEEDGEDTGSGTNSRRDRNNRGNKSEHSNGKKRKISKSADEIRNMVNFFTFTKIFPN
jgi:hypothetical protein